LHPARAALHLARPAMLPWLLLLVGAGFGFGHWDHALDLQGRGEVLDLLAVLGAWTLLHIGTMWRNAARDRDEGPVLFGVAAPPPAGLARAADLALLLAVGVALLAPPVATVSLAVCAALAVLYSHPRTAWKAHPVLGPAVNVIGYGLLTPLAGWAAAAVAPTPRLPLVLVCTAAAMAALTFVAQVFQGEEDGARGDRTLVVTHGPATCIRVARAGFALAGGLVFAQAAAGWLPRVLLLAVPVGLALSAQLGRWSRAPLVGGPAQARLTFRWLVALGLALVGLALADFLHASWVGGPVSGLATAVVPRF
jgi:4-hydroxybenzoate polyprenyltransferase